MEERFSYRVRRVCPDALRVLDTQDLHSLRKARQALVQAGRSSRTVHAGACFVDPNDSLLCRELSSMHRSDLSLLVSSYEQHLLTHHLGFPAHKLALAPFLYPDSAIERIANAPSSGKRSFTDRRNFIILGNFRHDPNADAVRYLHSEVWPRLRKLLGPSPPECHVYGAYPGPDHIALDDPTVGFRVFGPVSNHLKKLAQYRVHLAAVRFGAGIKGKITDSWMCGLPVVTTPIGAEGMYLADLPEASPTHATVPAAGYICPATGSCSGHPSREITLAFGGRVTPADDPDKLASAAAILYTDAAAWAAAQAVGATTLKRHFSAQAVAPGLMHTLAEAYTCRANRQRADGGSAVFWHPGVLGPACMGEYLEMKNKITPL